MRKLASIQTIDAINPIPNSDNIEVATILGWQVVVKKGEFKVGDLCIYIEVDSLLPKDNPVFAFMDKRKFRVKTIKLRGQISQGLALATHLFAKLPKKLTVGYDLSDILSIEKYEPPEDSGLQNTAPAKHSIFHPKGKLGRKLMKYRTYRAFASVVFPKVSYGFPSHIVSKTDEERIQSSPSILVKHAGKKYKASEKLEGQSATYILESKGFKKRFMVCSRNILLKNKDNSNYWQIAEKLNIEKLLRGIPGNKTSWAIQGEIVGPGIQGNIYKLPELDFFIFNVIKIQNGKRIVFNNDESISFAEQVGLKHVAIVEEGIIEGTVDDFVKKADGKSVLADVAREGLVFRGEGFSFKAVSNEYLLKNDF